MKIQYRILSAFALVVCFSASSYAQMFVGGAIGQTNYESPFDSASSYELTAGYRLNENFSAGVSYLNLGETDLDIEVDGFNFAVTGELPVGENFGVYAKLGYYTWDAGNNIDGNDLNYGIGANWYLSDKVALNLGYTMYELDNLDADNIGVGVTFSF